MSASHSSKIVGVISDTHGLMRPQALAALQEADLIVHAGDIGTPAVIDALRAIAPVHAVRGNNDRDAWSRSLPLTLSIEVEGHKVHVLHDIEELDLDPGAAGYSAVIAGHSHKPAAETRSGVLYLNPGSAGPRRFRLPIAIARLHISDKGIDHEIVQLSV